uniref:DNA repair protein REV1 n=1 Tax=Ceratitis capitata TaxID=7213 RepID=W8AT07_CERCA
MLRGCRRKQYRLQARMATKRAKPDGQYQLFPEVAQKYMADIKIDELPGVGSSTAYTLEQNNLITCGDLQKISLLKLQMHVGKKFGETLYQFSRGIDNRSLLYGQIRKSVSAEVNYGIRFKEFSELETFLRQLCTEVHTRLSDIKRQTKCVTLKLMVRAKDAPIEASKFMGHGVCDHLTKSVTLSGYTCELEVITRTVLATMKAMTVPPNELRGIGIQLSKLNDPNEGKERKENVIMNLFNKVADKKKERATKSAEDSNGDVAMQIEEPNVLLNCNSTLNVKKPEKHIKNVGKRSRDKIGDNNTLDAKSKNEPNILNLFKKAATKQAVSLNNLKCNGNPLPKDIDPEVFAALPPDIRNEVLHAYKDPKQGSALVIAQPQNQGSAITIMLPPSQSSNNSNVSTLNESDLQPSTSKAAAFRNQQKQLQKKMLSKQKSQVNLNNIELKTIPQYIEQEFLDALPPELRNEIKENFAQPTIKYEATSEVMLNQIDPEFLEALPSELRQEIEQNFGKSHGHTESNQRLTCETDDSLQNIFMEPKCEYLLLDWLKSSNVPEVVDTYLVSKHAAAMVKADKIDRLYSALMFLCKLINQQKSNECNWHKAYGSIIQFVQKEMSTSYDGRKLFLGVKLKCDKCKWQ